MTDLKVGSRVSDKNGNRGTVRYLGPVSISYKNPESVWAGVEWDDEGRGKYDGSVTDKGGVTTRYFTCKPSQGSFIKPAKLGPRLSFVDAVRDKYLSHDTINSQYRGEGSIKISAEWENSKTFDVELVGVDKIQKHLQLSVIDKVSLENENVAFFAPASTGPSLGELVPNIEELNLENVLISSWDDVFYILSQLPKLTRLYLSGNRLGDIPAALLQGGAKFHLKILVLNNTTTTWEQALSLATFFPDLEELHLEANGISFTGSSPEEVPHAEEAAAGDSGPAALPKPAESQANCPFPALHRLNLSKNGISNWNTMLQFARWPNLRHLMLNGNALESIEFGAGIANAEASFASLQCISLSNNRISSWQSVDALNSLPQLVALNFEGNPIGGGNLGPRQIRQLLIARVGNLATLNNSQVRRKERLDAEKQ